MYQFDHKPAAIEAARLLAAQTACPVLVMQSVQSGRFSIGLRSSLGTKQAGLHVATVHRSGLVEEGHCLKGQWLPRLLRNHCLCE